MWVMRMRQATKTAVTRGVLAFLVLALTASAFSSPARGIAFGAPDTTHTYVGAWIGQGADGSFAWCSGELVSPRVFLTAGHCVSSFLGTGVTVRTTWVTFDTNIFPPGVAPPSTTPGIVPGFAPPAPDWLAVSSFMADPLFNASAGSFNGLATFDLHDIAVVILKEGVTSVGFASLAPIGLLDNLQMTGALQHSSVSVLGYGWDENNQVTAQRRITQVPALGVAPHWLFLQVTNAATGGGGINKGDSGGPELLVLGGIEYLVAINNFFSGFPTSGIDGGYRVDTSGGLSFIQAEIASNS